MAFPPSKIGKKVDTINQHIDKVMENAPTKLKVSVNVNDADWQKIQELFTKERQWMVSHMMVVTLVTMPSGSSGSSSRLVFLLLQVVLV